MSTTFETSSASFQPESAQADYHATSHDIVQNLRDLLLLLDGSEVHETNFYNAYNKVFHKDARVLTYFSDSPLEDRMDPTKQVELDHDSCYQQVFLAYAKKRVKVENVSIQAPSADKIEYFVQLDQMGHTAVVHLSAETRDNKIYHLERKETRLLAIENLKNLFIKHDGSQPYNREQCFEAFEATFDENGTALTFPSGTKPEDFGDLSNRVHLNFNEAFANYSGWIQSLDSALKIVFMKPKEGGVLEYALQGSYMGDRFTCFNRAHSSHDKIVSVETLKVTKE